MLVQKKENRIKEKEGIALTSKELHLGQEQLTADPKDEGNISLDCPIIGT